MKNNNLREVLAQASEVEAVEIIQQTLRQSARLALFDAMEAEVNALCGAKHRPSESECRRAGSEVGSVYLEGEREVIKRPRVRDEKGEVPLEVYKAASTQRNLFDEVVSYMEQGLSQRGAARVKPTSLSKSAASRMWKEKSLEQLDVVRNRALSEHDFISVMIDGVRLAEGIWIIVALGIDETGKKVMLDFQEGSSENSTIVGELIDRLKKRGIDSSEEHRLMVVRDGSAAIKKAVSKHWPTAVQQECLVHMQRKTRDKLRIRDRSDFDNYCKNLRNAQGKRAGLEAFDSLIEFLSERNAAAAIALKQREEDLLAFHRLEAPSTLNVTFLNTNIIENSFRNWRESTGNVKKWSMASDMVSRWAASGMLWSESGFNKIRFAEDLGALSTALAAYDPSIPLRDLDSSPSANAVEKEACPSQNKC